MNETTTLSIRLDRGYMAKVEKWREKLRRETPGVNINLSDAVRSMIDSADEKTKAGRK